MADGHTINLEYIVRNHRGEDIKQDDKPVTSRRIIQECLIADNPQKPPTPAEKLIAGRLLFTKLTEKNPTFTTEELDAMKKRCADGCTSMTWFQLERILDGKADPLCD